MSRFFYCYQTTHDATGRFYRGVRSSKVAPELDPYLGSGVELRRLVKKHGRDAFSKTILSTHEGREEAHAAEREAVTLAELDDPLCINRQTGGVGNTTASAETRARISATKSGKKRSAEFRATIKAAHLGRKFTPEHRANISAARIGKKLSPETRAKLSLAQRTSPASLAHRERLAASRRGKKRSPDVVAKVAAAQRARRARERRERGE